jgi:carboxypeptidase C (cathepsin A)
VFKPFLCSFVLLLIVFHANAQQRPPQAPATPPAAQTAIPTPTPFPEVLPVLTQHEVKLGDRTLKYCVTTGMMPIKNAQTGETEAQMFFMAYTLVCKGDDK